MNVFEVLLHKLSLISMSYASNEYSVLPIVKMTLISRCDNCFVKTCRLCRQIVTKVCAFVMKLDSRLFEINF